MTDPERNAIVEAWRHETRELKRDLAEARSEIARLKAAVEVAAVALRGVETGCNPLTVPLEPMREVRHALAALEPWAK